MTDEQKQKMAYEWCCKNQFNEKADRGVAYLAGLNARDVAINKAISYCKPHMNQMWAASVVGALLGVDFRDASQTLEALQHTSKKDG